MKIVSLGAGVQSSTMLLLALHGEMDMPDGVIFADTGYEPKAVYEWLGLLRQKCEQAGLPFYVVSNGNIRKFEEQKDYTLLPLYVEAFGSTGMLRRQCTYHFKLEPIYKKVRELLRQKGEAQAELWIGISRDEVHRMKDARVPYVKNVYPLVELRMTRADCLNWLHRHGYPKPPKSSCLFCPYHDDAYWRTLKQTSKEEWDDVVAFDETVIRNKVPKYGKAYIHRSRLSLRELAERLDIQMTQTSLDLFGQECEGMCGV